MRRQVDEEAPHPSPQRRCRLLPSHTRMRSLPDGVFDAILAFLTADQLHRQLYPTPTDFRQLSATITPVSLVSRAWHAMATATKRRWFAHVAVIDVNAALLSGWHPPSSLASPHADVFVNADANDVRIRMRNVVMTPKPSPTSPKSWYRLSSSTFVSFANSRTALRPLSSFTIDWGALFRPRAVSMIRLDLSGVPLDSPHFGNALLAASTVCPHVKVLRLPTQVERYREDTDTREVNMNELYAAMQRWYRHNGGLLHLRIPFGRFDTRTATRLLRSLVAYCPSIEYVDGWQDTYSISDDGIVSSDAFWPAASEQWAAFWAGCPRLREFNLIVMPFGLEYLRGFITMEQELQLEHLTIAANTKASQDFTLEEDFLVGDINEFPRLKTVHFEVANMEDVTSRPLTTVRNVMILPLLVPSITELRIMTCEYSCLKPCNLSLVLLRDLGSCELQVLELPKMLTLREPILSTVFQAKPRLRLALSFVFGTAPWQLLDFLAETDRRRISSGAVAFSLSLKRKIPTKEDMAASHGQSTPPCMEYRDLRQLIDRLHELYGKDIRLHIHGTTCGTLSDISLVVLDHMELSLCDYDNFNTFRREQRPRLFQHASQVCPPACVRQGLVVTHQSQARG